MYKVRNKYIVASGAIFMKENDHANDLLHGIKLKDIVSKLVEYYGWEKLDDLISINCFAFDPSIKSSLKFLRKTPWARNKVEKLYINTTFDK